TVGVWTFTVDVGTFTVGVWTFTVDVGTFTVGVEAFTLGIERLVARAVEGLTALLEMRPRTASAAVTGARSTLTRPCLTLEEPVADAAGAAAAAGAAGAAAAPRSTFAGADAGCGRTFEAPPPTLPCFWPAAPSSVNWPAAPSSVEPTFPFFRYVG